jgi:hypothetical protein
MNWITILVLCIVAAGFMVSFVLAAVFLMSKLLSSAGGLSKLAAAFPTSELPAQQVQPRQTVQIGAVRYKNCTDFAVSPQGLYLCVRNPLGRPQPLLIPWHQMQVVGDARIYWNAAKVLSVGSPEIARVSLMMPHLSAIQPYLGSR